MDVLDPKDYYTASSAPEHRRQRVRNNLLGNHDWCPLVRRSIKLATIENEALEKKAREAIQKIPLDMLQRAVRYLYTKETRSSFAIERQTSSDREEKYVELLIHQSREGRYRPWDKTEFINVQQNLLDPRYAATDFRGSEVRISEVSDLSGAKERVHWVGAPAKDLASLMGGLCQAWKKHFEGLKLAIARSADQLFSDYPFLDFVLAGCLSIGFVYIHPFDDGNGRTHRLLLHYVLGQTGFSPENASVPISAAILRDLRGYDRILESYSKPAMELIAHRIDPNTSESMIENDCADLYRYIDLTAHIEQLGVWFRQASQHDVIDEIATLQALDVAQAEMRKIVDMPDKKLRNFLSICIENGRKPGGIGYRIGKNKRTRLFPELTDMEIERLETAIIEAFEDLVR